MSSGQPVGNKAGWEWVEDGAKGATEDSGTVEQRKKTGGDSGANASRVCVCVCRECFICTIRGRETAKERGGLTIKVPAPWVTLHVGRWPGLNVAEARSPGPSLGTPCGWQESNLLRHPMVL